MLKLIANASGRFIEIIMAGIYQKELDGILRCA